MLPCRKLGCLLVGALSLFGLFLGSASADERPLPMRKGPVPGTTKSVPHIEIDARTVPEISNHVLGLVAAIPGVKLRPTVISLPGAKGFWLNENLDLLHPEAIVGGREFAHQHPDGSLHASLSPERAQEAVDAGWAVFHPWSRSRPGWDGFVLLFTPRTREEADITFQLVVDSYNYVTGRNYLSPNR
jgi:luciferase-like monooxygenase